MEFLFLYLPFLRLPCSGGCTMRVAQERETLPGDCRAHGKGTEVHAGPGSCQRENSPVHHHSGHFSDSSFQKLEAEVLSSIVRQVAKSLLSTCLFFCFLSLDQH